MTIRRSIDLIESYLGELAPYKNDERVKTFVDMNRNGTDERNPIPYTQRMPSFLSFIEEKGFKPLGVGAFAAVFTHEGLDYAIKVFKDDDDYLQFIDFCNYSKNNPHLPKFRGKPMTIDKKHYLVRMELLDKLNGYNDEVISSLQATSNQLGLNYSASNLKNMFKKLQHMRVGPYIEKIKKEQPKFFKTVIELQENHGSKLDLHVNNVMQRGETLVITDPYYTY